MNDFLLTLDRVFETIHDVSASHLEGFVTLCFPSREMPRKQELVVDRGQLVSLFAVQEWDEEKRLNNEPHADMDIPAAPNLPPAPAS